MYIKLNTISLFYETFGNPNHTPLLLMMGAGSQGVLWPDDFCKLLTHHNLYVIRYDHRDTGLSTCVNYEDHPYNLTDLANDALELLDQLNISKAHMVGLSMGGYLVQLIAINHPERLITATLIMSTPNHMVFMNALVGKDTSSNLPKPKKEALEFFAMPPADMSNRESVINHSIQTWKLLNGSKAPYDETYWGSLITRHYDRIQNHNAQYNHGRACFASPEDRTFLLTKVNVPTLIIHGSEDPMLPLAHGQALANAISDSEFIVIKNMGHALNPIFHHEIISAIVNHIHDHPSSYGNRIN